ncbi:MAG: hypothetical protein B0D88_07930 [Candidatus Sedimenticola endophacoides]|nr:MAG: hypothetical protein B0D88_07930 [Candidatus Sedimenticola endophacoides]
MTGERFNATALLIRESTREAVEQILGAVPNIDLQVVMGATHQTLSRLRDSNLPDIILVEINGRSSNDISDIETLLANHHGKSTLRQNSHYVASRYASFSKYRIPPGY